MINDDVALFNNVEEIVFKGNEIKCGEEIKPHITVQHVANEEIKTELSILR